MYAVTMVSRTVTMANTPVSEEERQARIEAAWALEVELMNAENARRQRMEAAMKIWFPDAEEGELLAAA